MSADQGVRLPSLSTSVLGVVGVPGTRGRLCRHPLGLSDSTPS